MRNLLIVFIVVATGASRADVDPLLRFYPTPGNQTGWACARQRI